MQFQVKVFLVFVCQFEEERRLVEHGAGAVRVWVSVCSFLGSSLHCTLLPSALALRD